jgi:hypothetical protein
MKRFQGAEPLGGRGYVRLELTAQVFVEGGQRHLHDAPRVRVDGFEDIQIAQDQRNPA